MRGTGGLRFASACIALLTALWASNVQADDALTTRVEATLTAGVEASSAHYLILTLGEPGRLALHAVFARKEAPSYVRLRALSLLSELGNAETATLLADIVRSTEQPPSADQLHPGNSPLVLRRALEGLVALAEKHAPPLSAAQLAPCLSHHDPHVRKVAADLLPYVEGAVEPLLAKKLVEERSSMVRGRLQQALTSRLARRAARPVGLGSELRPR